MLKEEDQVSPKVFHPYYAKDAKRENVIPLGKNASVLGKMFKKHRKNTFRPGEKQVTVAQTKTGLTAEQLAEKKAKLKDKLGL